MNENKYVVEAIFENVLLENGMYRFPLSNLNETEKKQLMEKVLMNEEFKEYIYQKIIKGQDNAEVVQDPEPQPLEKSANEKDQAQRHLMSDAMTNDEALEISMQNRSAFNKSEI